MKQILLPVIIVMFAAVAEPASFASKCYGEQGCTACKNCRYCKHCNSGTADFCGVYYDWRGITPRWKPQNTKKQKEKKAA